MLTYTAKLLQVRTGDFNSLVFQGVKWDAGLQKEVEASVSVMISKDHMYLVEEYKKMQGSVVTLPVRDGVTKKGQIWYSTAANGRFISSIPPAPKVG